MHLLKVDKSHYVGQADPYILKSNGRYYCDYCRYVCRSFRPPDYFSCRFLLFGYCVCVYCYLLHNSLEEVTKLAKLTKYYCFYHQKMYN